VRCTDTYPTHFKRYSKNPAGQASLFWTAMGKKLKSILNELKSYNISDQSQIRIVLFNVNSDRGFQKKFVFHGIHGFFYEHDPIDIFLKGIRAILDGKLWLSREMMTKCILEDSGKNKSSKIVGRDLTERQIPNTCLGCRGCYQ